MALDAHMRERAQANNFSIASISALTATALLGGASILTNVSSAVTRHPDLAGKLVSGAVALAVALIAMVGLAASLQALARKQYVLSAMAALAFTLAAAFSVSSAAGIMGGARLQASLSVGHVESERKRIADERAKASAELTMTVPARSSAEITPELASRLSIKGVDGCATINGPATRQHCPVIADLQAELARSQSIAALNGAIARLDGEAAKLGAPTIANKDAAAISHVLAALGMKIDAETINTALMVLAVLILEIGPALSLAVATALRSHAPVVPTIKDITPVPSSAPVKPAASVPAVITPAAVASAVAPSPAPATGLARDAADRVAKIVRDAGGELHVASKRELARRVGVTSATIGRALASLAGAVAITQSTDGLTVRLAA